MTAEPQPKSHIGGALIQMLIGLVLAAGIALYFKNQDLLIDRVPFISRLDMRTVWAVLAVLALVAVVLWVNGHRALAISKGYSSFAGLVLGFVLLLGLLILLLLPSKRQPAQAPAAKT